MKKVILITLSSIALLCCGDDLTDDRTVPVEVGEVDSVWAVGDAWTADIVKTEDIGPDQEGRPDKGGD
mgnify:FL=1|tara:strand:+ start:581 stop:784 length:204 start_codon:yes stop_codon:yes gene_type:complete